MTNHQGIDMSNHQVIDMTYSTAIDTQLSTLSLKLTPQHQAHIEARGIYSNWADENCITFDIPGATVMLGYKAKSAGIMLVSDEYGQWQFKPDEPWGSKDGKAPKYRTGKGEYDAFLAKHPTIKAYWSDLDALKARCFTIDGQPYLLITEGGFKSIMGCQHDIPTIGLVGVTMGLTPKAKGEPDLIPVLKKLAEAGFGFIIAFDADAATNKNVRIAEAKLSKVLAAYGCPVKSVAGLWEPGTNGETKGMDDFINKKGIEEFRAILTNAYSLESRDTRNGKLPTKSKNKQFLDLVETHWGERLRLNEMTQQVELNGKAGELNVERAYLRLAEELSVDIPKQTASDLVLQIAEKYTYSPVRDYLKSVASVAPINLDDLALRYFGIDNPLHAVLLKRTLIAAVARVFKPGCKVDTLCILQGSQGTLKSTFWQTLVGEAWFTDNLNDANEKDEKLKLRRYWMLEFSEFESAYKRKEVEQLKAFLSSRVDSLRKPYGKAIEDFPRTSVFVGSTNRQEFLHDPTGERRYWVIPVAQKIPIHTVEEERDRIWSAAVAAYKAGEQWWLTPDEDALLAQANQGWQSSDAWESDVLTYVENLTTCTISELLTKAIKIELGNQGKAHQMRVSDILRRNGWAKSPTQRRIGGKPQWFWERVITGSDGVVTEVVTEVVTPSNPATASLIDKVSPPVTTFSPNFCENDGDVVELPAPEKSKSFESKVVTPPPQDSGICPQQDLENVTTSPSPPLKTFAIGDRVVIKDVGGIYQGTRGQIVDTLYSRAGNTYLVRFDKSVRNVQQLEVEPSDLMKL